MIELRFETTVDAKPEDVWARVTTLAGVNHELGPLLRMSAPRGATIEDAPIGRPWFRSWVFFLKVIPIDFDHLCLESIDPPRGFHERSTMLSARVWEHKRTLTGATTIVDELRFEPRPLFGPLLRLIIPLAFRHRHRRLKRHFA